MDSIYFEDFVAKAILFRKAEKIYGIKPNAIGDLRFITVPYTISYLNFKLKNPINLFKIWEEQDLSESLDLFLHDAMKKVEEFIKRNAPGSLFSEWAKKEECWSAIKKSNIIFDISGIESDLIDNDKPPLRKKKSSELISLMSDTYETDGVISIAHSIWKNILQWGCLENKLTLLQQENIKSYLLKKQNSIIISKDDTISLNEILAIVADEEPNLLEELENSNDEISYLEIMQKKAAAAIEWIKINRHSLSSERYTFLKEIRDGKKMYSIQNKVALDAVVKYLYEFGFEMS